MELIFLQRYGLRKKDVWRGDCGKRECKRVVAVLKRQAHVGIIMGDIVFVMHYKEFPERHVNHRTMLCIMLDQQRKSQQLMTLS